MKEKKVAVMTIRMTPATKAAIEREAERRDWTPSKTAERILSAWAEQQLKKEQEGEREGSISVRFYQNDIGNIQIK